MTYQQQREKSDMYIESGKSILRQHSSQFLKLEVSDDYKDTQEATDILIKAAGCDVAFRVREPSCNYRDFTIRTRSRYGNRTEIHKLKDGFADLYLYGWGDGKGNIVEYILVDLDKVRKFKVFHKFKKEDQLINSDGTMFIPIPIGMLIMHGCIVTRNLSDQTERFVDEYIESKLNAM